MLDIETLTLGVTISMQKNGCLLQIGPNDRNGSAAAPMECEAAPTQPISNNRNLGGRFCCEVAAQITLKSSMRQAGVGHKQPFETKENPAEAGFNSYTGD